MAMHFRVTDEQTWAHGFDADTPSALAAGIRAGCAAWRERGGHGTMLVLHVLGNDGGPRGRWMPPSSSPQSPAVDPNVTDEWCSRWLASAAEMVRHTENLTALADGIADDIVADADAEEQRQRQKN